MCFLTSSYMYQVVSLFELWVLDAGAHVGAPRFTTKNATTENATSEEHMPKSLRPNLYRTIKIVMSDGATFRVPSAVRTVGNTLQLDRDPANHPAYLVRAAASLAQSPCATEAHRESPPPRPVLLYRVRPISRVCLVVARSSALSECGPKPSRTSSISVYCVGRATRVRFPCKRSRCHALLTPTACGSLHSGACSVRSPHFDARPSSRSRPSRQHCSSSVHGHASVVSALRGTLSLTSLRAVDSQ